MENRTVIAADQISQQAFWDCSPTPGLSVGGGVRSFEEEAAVSENLGSGIKLAILLEGCIEVGIADQDRVSETAPSVNLFVSRDTWQLNHRFVGSRQLRYLTLHLAAETIENLLGDADMTLACGIAHFRSSCPSAMKAVVQQIMHSPYSGVARHLHLAGKSLELAALAMDTLTCSRPVTLAALASPLEVRRLHELRQRLERDYASLPNLAVLARDCGLNVRKMTAGFRRLFGQSISEYLRDVRLREAWRLLESGMSVTATAEHIGYTLPHFSTAFQRRYGIGPGTLGQKGVLR